MNIIEGGKILEKKSEAILREKPLMLIGIDGRAGGGKSTFAGFLSELYRWQTVSMDDFFLPPEKRTEKRLSTPGENVDHERFLKEVLEPLALGQRAKYRPFSCRKQAFEAEKEIIPGGVIIIEGAYSHHPDLRPYYDFTVFITTDPESQKKRILEREGREKLESFITKWIPLEEAYIEAFHPDKTADMLLNFHL